MRPNFISLYEGRELWWRIEDDGDALDIELLTPVATVDVDEATAAAARDWEKML